MSQIDRSLAEAARAWPFEEARKLVTRVGDKAPAKGYVLLETGYGPSGLPHIGTFGDRRKRAVRAVHAGAGAASRKRGTGLRQTAQRQQTSQRQSGKGESRLFHEFIVLAEVPTH